MTAFEPLDPDFQNDPYPAYALLRDADPIHHHPAGPGYPAYWALSRFDDVWNAVREPETFSSAEGLTFFPDEIGKLGLPPNIVMLDAPRHTRLRSLIGRGFTPRHVTRLEELIRTFCRERIAAMRSSRTPDL
ncbi:MAG TPA: cytochrome P450, partial [Marmoricola sp.]|nr:cytochrome P450 [Marmoricola sp.]